MPHSGYVPRVNGSQARRDVDIRVEILDSFQQSIPLQVVTPTQDGDFTFTHKSAGLPISKLPFHSRPSKSAADVVNGESPNLSHGDK